MNIHEDDILRKKVATAKAVVDRLVSVASGVESDDWMAKYRLVQQALAEGRLRDAIREEARLTSSRTGAKWIVSQELSKTLSSTMAVLLRHLHDPGHNEPVMEMGELPTDITAHGTDAERREEALRRLRESFRHDPLEDDPSFAVVLQAASERAEQELADHPRGIGFCHVFWEKKQEILREQYGLEWKTPAELNPHMTFD